ncbi:MAG: hypothetical protein WD772_00650 [Pseudohongiellaceae bacterium]
MIKEAAASLLILSIAGSANGQNNSNSVFNNPLESDQSRARAIRDMVRDAIPSPTVEALDSFPQDTGLVVENLYFHKLFQRMQASPAVIEAQLELSQSQLSDVYLVLMEMQLEDRKISQENIVAMCEEWAIDEVHLTEQQRATNALNKQKSLDATRLERNQTLLNMFDILSEKIGEDAVEVLKTDLAGFSSRNNINNVMWADFVRSTGNDIKQMKFSCGE